MIHLQHINQRHGIFDTDVLEQKYKNKSDELESFKEELENG